MINIAIWGCRDGVYLYEQILKTDACKYNVVAIADNATKYQGSTIHGLKVCNLEQLVSEYRNSNIEKIIIAVRKGYSRFCIIKKLKESNINETDIILLRPSSLIFRTPIIFDESDERYKRQWYSITEKNRDRTIIHHLESNLADGCNLNCRGCLHFSNLYKMSDFPNEEAILEGVKAISAKCEIFQFRVLGGEPLLNKNLPDFLVKLRKILPYCDIAIISNGILIPKVEEKLFEIMKQCHIGFILTLYQPTFKMKDMIYDRLKEYGVPYGSHEAKTDLFEKFIMLEPAISDEHPYESCEPRGILVLKDGSLYRCPIEAYIGKYCETYNLTMDIPEGIDVTNDQIDWKVLIEDLYTKPRSLCKYCSKHSSFFEWGNGHAEKKDWIVEENNNG